MDTYQSPEQDHSEDEQVEIPDELHSLGVDDLLSDESDNDDVVDNEELAQLLKSQNVAMDDLLPSNTNYTQVHSTTEPTIGDGVQKVIAQEQADTSTTSTYSQNQSMDNPDPKTIPTAIHPSGTLHSTYIWKGKARAEPQIEVLRNESTHLEENTQPSQFMEGIEPFPRLIENSSSMDGVSTIDTPTQSRSNPLMSSLRNLWANSSVSEEPELPQSQVDQHMQDVQGGDETEIDEKEQEDEPPEPVWITHEENVRLTGILRKEASESLAINQAYQQAILRQLQVVEKAYARNAELKAQLKEILDRHALFNRAPVFLPSTNVRLGPPYFVDQEQNVPPNNEDAIKRKKKELVAPAYAKRWTKVERENLKAGVISENKRLLFDAFSANGDIEGIKSLDTASDVQMMLNTKDLDWSRIAQRYVDTRTASECLIRWTGHDHPGINKSAWSKRELDMLDELAAKYKYRNWIQIALDLDTNRTGAECFKMYQTKTKKSFSKEAWTEEEDAIMIEAVRLFGEQNWQQVANCIDGRSAAQCNHHWTKSLNPVIRRGRWLEEEDGALRTALEVYGEAKWVKIQQHIPGRTDVQCRERYVNVLSPKVKTGPWTTEESEKLMGLVQTHGDKKWAHVASLMDGRTDNQCARRYRMLIQEKLERKRKTDKKQAKSYLSTNRRKGRTTIAQLPDLANHRGQIRKEAAKARKKQRFEEFLQRKRELEKLRALNLQEKSLQLDYDIFTERQRYLYDLWNQRWGHRVDPIEKVFNIGVPSMPKAPRERTEDDPTIVSFKAPDPSSALRPGKVRPVPPCSATVDAFSRFIKQGAYSDGRFKLKYTIDDGKIAIEPPSTTPISVKEQSQPEYIELAERFESVFMWPMMMGMLHMGTARELVETPPKPPPRKGRRPNVRAEPSEDMDETSEKRQKPRHQSNKTPGEGVASRKSRKGPHHQGDVASTEVETPRKKLRKSRRADMAPAVEATKATPKPRKPPKPRGADEASTSEPRQSDVAPTEEMAEAL
ncbi:Myb-like DNA-binding domain protein [Haplosporangium sp. Z 27]|nr:Myb-like DNA-binding domain protein [Haplosporangium sp. Z 27]